MENIIKKAIEGGWDKSNAEIDIGQVTSIMHFVNEIAILDPLFWQALFKGTSCWHSDGAYRHHAVCLIGEYEWKHHAFKFYEKNLTQGWSKAVEYLESIIK